MAASTVRGFFSDDSMVRRVNREGVVLLGGGRALLMQIAHPMIAAGVAEHSAFPDKGRERLMRTLRLTFAIIFGSERQAMDAIEDINLVHQRVYGPGYSATDPDLLFWVHAVFIDTTLLFYGRFVRRMSLTEKETYYQEAKKVALLLGIPDATMPADLKAFEAYMAEAIAAIRVSADGRRLAPEVLSNAPGGPVTRWLMRRVTVESLPAHLREQFGFSSSSAEAKLVELLGGASRLVTPLVPSFLRRPPWFLMPPGDGVGSRVPLEGTNRQRIRNG
jgi:uncharacterized protein (DUF2236 family)